MVEASAGGGMVKVKMGGDLTLREVAIDPDAIDPEEAELLAEMVQAAVNEGLRAAQELASSKMGGITGGIEAAGLPGCEQRGTGAARPPGRRARPTARNRPATAQRLAFHILRAPDEESEGLATAIREVKEGRALRALLRPRRGPLCRICADPNREQSTICVVEERPT